jgi:hypothetical protein
VFSACSTRPQKDGDVSVTLAAARTAHAMGRGARRSALAAVVVPGDRLAVSPVRVV